LFNKINNINVIILKNTALKYVKIT